MDSTFTHANGIKGASGYMATVNWGITGHTADTAKVTQNSDGSFTVKATRPVFTEGTYTVVVSISEVVKGGVQGDGHDTQLVTIGVNATLASVVEGANPTAVPVATFTHNNGSDPASEFVATINWGIAGHAADPGTVTRNSDGSYTVTGTRPAYEAGSYTVQVSVTELPAGIYSNLAYFNGSNGTAPTAIWFRIATATLYGTTSAGVLGQCRHGIRGE